jgi:hypothetical protein
MDTCHNAMGLDFMPEVVKSTARVAVASFRMQELEL